MELNVAQVDRLATRTKTCPRCVALPEKACWERARGNPTRKTFLARPHAGEPSWSRRTRTRYGLMGVVMIDTERLFDSLNRATEFTVTEDHLKLLRHLCDGGLYWDPGEGFGGAPYFGSKKPYGSSDVPQDVAEILDAPDSDWEWHEAEVVMPPPELHLPPPDKRFKILRAEAEDRYLRLHVEAGIALKIALVTGEFRAGRYTCTDAWSNDWTRA